MSLRARISILIGGLVIMSLSVMLFGLSTLSDYNRMMDHYGRAYENAYMGERLNRLISSVVMESRGIYHSRSVDETRMFAARLDRNLDEIDAVLLQWREKGTASDDVGLDRLEGRARRFVETRRALSLAAVTQGAAAAEAIGVADRPERISFQGDIDRMVAATRRSLEAETARADAYRHERVVSFVAVTLVWVLLAGALSFWVVQHFIMREIERARVADENRERLLKQLMESNTELERFAYVASHDMQEPVRMVNIYSQLVAEDYRDRLDEKGRRYLGVISTSANRMHLMVQDLLRYSRLKHEPFEDSTVDLATLMNHVRANLGQRIAETDAVIKADDLPKVAGNPVQLQRLFENLIGNAMTYQAEGRSPLITVSAEAAGGRWRICVTDNGIGIEPEYARQVFEPFRRLHTWDKYNGTGLGLTICRKIVERHGGEIWIEPAPDHGARFCFTLARAPEAPVSAAA